MKLGSGALCRDTFFVRPSGTDPVTMTSTASAVMAVQITLYVARFLLISLTNSTWQKLGKLSVVIHILSLLTCGLSAHRLYSDLQYCTMASTLPPSCHVVLDDHSYDWFTIR